MHLGRVSCSFTLKIAVQNHANQATRQPGKRSLQRVSHRGDTRDSDQSRRTRFVLHAPSRSPSLLLLFCPIPLCYSLWVQDCSASQTCEQASRQSGERGSQRVFHHQDMGYHRRLVRTGRVSSADAVICSLSYAKDCSAKNCPDAQVVYFVSISVRVKLRRSLPR